LNFHVAQASCTSLRFFQIIISKKGGEKKRRNERIYRQRKEIDWLLRNRIFDKKKKKKEKEMEESHYTIINMRGGIFSKWTIFCCRTALK
jgi:phosphorylcholine metabolism protein LicD